MHSIDSFWSKFSSIPLRPLNSTPRHSTQLNYNDDDVTLYESRVPYGICNSRPMKNKYYPLKYFISFIYKMHSHLSLLQLLADFIIWLNLIFFLFPMINSIDTLLGLYGTSDIPMLKQSTNIQVESRMRWRKKCNRICRLIGCTCILLGPINSISIMCIHLLSLSAWCMQVTVEVVTEHSGSLKNPNF